MPELQQRQRQHVLPLTRVWARNTSLLVLVLLCWPFYAASAGHGIAARSASRIPLKGLGLPESDRSTWRFWVNRASMRQEAKETAKGGVLTWADGTPLVASNWSASWCAPSGPFGAIRTSAFRPLDGLAKPTMRCHASSTKRCEHAMSTLDWSQSCSTATLRSVLPDDGSLDVTRRRRGGDLTKCGEAWVTLLGDDAYLPGVVTLVHSIRQYSRVPRDVVVLAGPKVSSRVRQYLLRDMCVHVRTYEMDIRPPCSHSLESARGAGRRHCESARSSGVMSKLLAFALTEYCRVAIVDADIFFFDDPEVALWPSKARGGGRKAFYAAPRFRRNHAFFGSHRTFHLTQIHTVLANQQHCTNPTRLFMSIPLRNETVINAIPDIALFSTMMRLIGDATVVKLMARWGFSEQELLNLLYGSCRSRKDAALPLGTWGRLPHDAVPNVASVHPSQALALKIKLARVDAASRGLAAPRRWRRRTYSSASSVVGLHANRAKPWRAGWRTSPNNALLETWFRHYRAAGGARVDRLISSSGA